MEVETWPPLVDGKLGLHGHTSPDLGLSIADEDILSDEERELLQSPVREEDQTTCDNEALVNGDEHETNHGKVKENIAAKCNDDSSSETVSDAARVFRTEKDSGTVRGTELGEEHSKPHNEGTNGSICAASVGRENGLGEDSVSKEDEICRKSPLFETSDTNVIVEDPCSLDAAELHVREERVKCGVEDENVDECKEDQLLDSGLSPKSLKDYGDDLDDMEIPQVIDISSISEIKEDEDAPDAGEVCNVGETADIGESEDNVEDDEAVLDDEEIPQVIDISSICVAKETEGPTAACDEANDLVVDPETVVPDKECKSRTESVDDVSIASQNDISSSVAEGIGIASAEGDVTENSGPAVGEDAEKVTHEEGNRTTADSTEEVPVLGGEGIEDNSPAADDDNMDYDQGQDGSPDYQGMTDDILPIIESELDDMPEGEGNIFDTEVECDDGTSLQEEAEDIDEEASCSLPAEIEVDVGSPRVSGGCQTVEKTLGESSTQKDLDSNSSSQDRVNLKRRASADNAATPPSKVLKRQSSLDDLSESAGRSDSLKTLDEFKKLSMKKLPVGAPNSIASEPLDIPMDVEDPTNSSSVTAKRVKTPEPEVEESSGTEGVVQPAKIDSSKDESVLVIDLDDDDDEDKVAPVKPPSSSSGEMQSPTKEQAEPSNGPKSALDILFNGKKEITLNRKMFSRVMKSYVSQYLLTFSELGKATSLSLKANDVLNKIQSSVSNFEKQKDDFKSIMNKLIEDRQARKTWDENLMPPRATRSVGLQVCSVGSMYVKSGLDDGSLESNKNAAKAKSSCSSSNQSQALAQQKQAYAQQKMAMAQSRTKQAEQQLNSIRPIAKKSVTPTNRPVAMKTVPVSKPVTQVKPNGTQFPVATPKLNGLRAVTVTRNPEQSSPSSPPVTVTTVSPNSRTYTLSSKGTFALKSPPKSTPPPQYKQPNSMLSKALTNSGVPSRPVNIAPKTSPQNASKAVPVSLTPGTIQTSKNLASGPGRPGKSPAPGQTSSSSVADATIDLTDDDGPPPPTKVTPRENSTARKSTAPSRIGVSAKVPVGSKQMRHPPLPPNPPNFNAAAAPPRPTLGICDTQAVTQGIMLTWHFNNVIPIRKISKFQVFAYQESKGDGEDAWKKVGDVDALPLPMACTLTQFREGYTYHFIVRALDEAGHVGSFSAPNTITLMKKTV
ncbi:hypothetical protein GE061_003817 [Apolygus lucorum]|uniref:Uncharacterized protein n=1 Tax=Apolygus lucorum TaxID=248454 RepID=A0A6A4JPJ5_APOLU|nr:hypothetical protein GE061_003817 [Apolygus lucorum]